MGEQDVGGLAGPLRCGDGEVNAIRLLPYVEAQERAAGPLLPDEFGRARAAKLTPALGEPNAIAEWVRGGGGAWHLAIDTGMNRAGIPWDRVDMVRDLVASHPPEGAFTLAEAAGVAVVFKRAEGAKCARSWRFTDDVGSDPDYPDLSARDAAAVREFDQRVSR